MFQWPWKGLGWEEHWCIIVLYHILSHFLVPAIDKEVAIFISIFQIRKLIIWKVVTWPKSLSLRDRARIWTQSAYCSEPISLSWFSPPPYQGLPIHLQEPPPRIMALLCGCDPRAAQGPQHHPSLTVWPAYHTLGLYLSPCPSMCHWPLNNLGARSPQLNIHV